MPDYPKLYAEPTQPATIGDLKIDVIESREVNYDSDVTEYPVEDGFAISDHVERKPLRLSLDVVCTPTPVSWFEQLGASPTRMNEVVEKIAEIYKKGEPITVTTYDAIYRDMIMTSAPLPRNVSDGYCYKMQLEFVHVRRVAQKTEAVSEEKADAEAAGSAGETEKDAGAANQQEIGSGVSLIKTDAGVYSTDLTRPDMDSAGRAVAGRIETMKEQTAHAAAIAVINLLVSAVWRK